MTDLAFIFKHFTPIYNTYYLCYYTFNRTSTIMIEKSGFFTTVPNFEMFGQIQFSNGNTSDILVTKRHALEVGEVHVGISITDEEWSIIRQQIHDSNLLDKNSELEELVNQAQTMFAELKNKLGAILKEQKKGDWWKDEG